MNFNKRKDSTDEHQILKKPKIEEEDNNNHHSECGGDGGGGGNSSSLNFDTVYANSLKIDEESNELLREHCLNYSTFFIQSTGDKPALRAYHRFKNYLISNTFNEDKQFYPSKIHGDEFITYTKKELAEYDEKRDCLHVLDYGTDYFLYYNGIFEICINVNKSSFLMNSLPSYTLEPKRDFIIKYYDNSKNLLAEQSENFKSIMVFRGDITSTERKSAGSQSQTFKSWAFKPDNTLSSGENVVQEQFNLYRITGERCSYRIYEYCHRSDSTTLMSSDSRIENLSPKQFNKCLVGLTNIRLKYGSVYKRYFPSAEIAFIVVEK